MLGRAISIKRMLRLSGKHPIAPIRCIVSETSQYVMDICQRYLLLTYSGTKLIMQINRLRPYLLLLSHPHPNNNHRLNQ